MNIRISTTAITTQHQQITGSYLIRAAITRNAVANATLCENTRHPMAL
jgi:hypothetical protein